jgi:anti-sigma factor RsiW
MNDHLSNDLLVDFVHGELPPELDAAAHVHLAGCAACREEHELEATLSEALRAAAQAEEREMPSLVNAAVWDRIRSARPGPMARFAAWLRPGYALPLAAAIVAGGFFASPLAHPSVPKIDASYYLEAHAADTSATPLSERSSALVLETSMMPAPSSPSTLRANGGVAATGAVDDVH